MKGSFGFLIALLAVTFAGCVPSTVPPSTVATTLGNVGRESGKAGEERTTISVTRWQHGDQLTYSLLAQLPGDDPAPVALLLIRGTSPDERGSNHAQGQSEASLYWRGQLTAANGKPFDLAYDVNYKPRGHELRLGGQAVDLDSGRFFLIDLAQDPVKPVQVKDKIVPLLPSTDPTEVELKTAVETLKQKQQKVREFLEMPR
jgi:hypothetical protein